MRYWWVNQNHTYDAEVPGGFLWSPKTRSDGARNQFYENMRLVKPGDVVFSFRAAHIKAIGVATGKAASAPKPNFGKPTSSWSNEGWRVPVKFRELANPIRPKDHIGVLRPHLPSKYSPLRKSGDGLENVYLAEIPKPLAIKLVELIGPDYDSVMKGMRALSTEASDVEEETIEGRAEYPLSKTVIDAWDEAVRRKNHHIPAEEHGKPFSIKDFQDKLRPIREELVPYINRYLSQVPAYQNLRAFPAAFWGPGRKGAYLKEYIWIYAAQDRDKTRGRLQLTFCPAGIIRSEFVAYEKPVTTQDRTYHIEQLGRWVKDPNWFKEFKKGCQELPPGFIIQYKTGKPTSVDGKQISSLADSDWQELHEYGLANAYFVIARDRHRSYLSHLTGEELAQLVIADWTDLSGLYPLLIGKHKIVSHPVKPDLPPMVNSVHEIVESSDEELLTPEFEGKLTSYSVNQVIEAERKHGPLVNTLLKELRALNLAAQRSRLKDCYVNDKDGGMVMIFEAKTDCSTTSLYTGVGQLMIHGVRSTRTARRILVLPEPLGNRQKETLDRLGIEILFYRWEGDKPIFVNLASIVSGEKKWGHS
jgi:hypothetical protein